MVNILVTSREDGAGKTALCAGLAQRLIARGKRVGYLKPLAVTPAGEDADSQFVPKALGLGETPSPLPFTPKDLQAALESPDNGLRQKLQRALGQLSGDRDVVILEGISGLSHDLWSQITQEMAQSLDAKTILVVRYRSGVTAEDVVSWTQGLGEGLLGVAFNAVPPKKVEAIKKPLASALEERGSRLLGIIPEDRALFTLSLGELAQHLGGEILNCRERSHELVENLMLGAMVPRSGLEYFQLKPDKAVITRGDRPDLQMAALATSTACLILSRGIPPLPHVLHRAQEQRVPIILVKADTASTIAAIEEALAKTRFHQEKKLERLDELLAEHLDWPALYNHIGLLGR